MRGLAALAAAVGALALGAQVAAAPGVPDLIVAADTLAGEWSVAYDSFDPTTCEYQEGLVPDASVHRFLYFTTKVANVGTADLRVGPPKKNSGDWEYFACHGHWHFLRFASYELRDAAGNLVGQGHKQSWCMEDFDVYDPTLPGFSPSNRYTCSRQGISVGWADTYWSGLPGQWVIVDDVPPGTYWLTVTVNYARVLPESNYDNDSATVPVLIG